MFKILFKKPNTGCRLRPTSNSTMLGAKHRLALLGGAPAWGVHDAAGGVQDRVHTPNQTLFPVL